MKNIQKDKITIKLQKKMQTANTCMTNRRKINGMYGSVSIQRLIVKIYYIQKCIKVILIIGYKASFFKKQKIKCRIIASTTIR